MTEARTAESAKEIGVKSELKGEQTYLTLEDFMREYYDREDGYKYEWNDGEIEKTQGMNQEQAIIQAILMRLFIGTKVLEEGGIFISEVDMYTSKKQLRKPDLAIFLGSQVSKLKKESTEIAPWVAEIISESDNINRVNLKVDEYFNAGVQVVWHIFPASKQVYVFTAADKVTICRGKTVCSGKPAIANFEIAAEDLFVLI